MSKNTLTAATDHFWYSRGRPFAVSAEGDTRQLCAMAFQAGAHWNMRESTRLNPYVSQFIEMLILLGVFDGELATQSSAPDSASASIGASGDQGGVGDG